jgi:8-hydroxy-5-deazaflavin:NADPH oxidoreductase
MTQPQKLSRSLYLAAGMLGAIAMVAAAAVGVRAADAAAPMRIGIIGAGKIGGTLAELWSRAGHEVMISSRHPEELKALARKLGPKVHVGTPAEAAAFGPVVVVSVPYAATPQVGRDYAQELKGKVVLDTGNPYPDRDGPMANAARAKGAGPSSQEFLPGTRLVRAFNAIKYTDLHDESNRKGERFGIPLAGNDADALKVAAGLVRDAGVDPVVVGDLSQAKRFDVGTNVYVKLMTAKQLKAALGLH